MDLEYWEVKRYMHSYPAVKYSQDLKPALWLKNPFIHSLHSIDSCSFFLNIYQLANLEEAVDFPVGKIQGVTQRKVMQNTKTTFSLKIELNNINYLCSDTVKKKGLRFI